MIPSFLIQRHGSERGGTGKRDFIITTTQLENLFCPYVPEISLPQPEILGH
jgi:hypothetical protein